MEFSVEKLESILLAEAEKRGERLYRVSLCKKEETLFVSERLMLDRARLEGVFNVIRVSPEGEGIEEMPDRVIYYLSSDLSFEKTANTAAAILNGAVDIVEIPYSSWNDEKARWMSERKGARIPALDGRRMDIATLILSYKILHFDMERILSAIKGERPQDAKATLQLSRFEKRLTSLEPAKILFLSFSHKSHAYILPRYMISGFRWKDGLRLVGSAAEEDGDNAPLGGLDPGSGMGEDNRRFSIILSPSKGGPSLSIGADRLFSYREISLADIKISSRLSRVSFAVNIQGEDQRLILPDSSLGD